MMARVRDNIDRDWARCSAPCYARLTWRLRAATFRARSKYKCRAGEGAVKE